MARAIALQRLDNRWHTSPDRYTPEWLLVMVSDFLGDYLDPCPARHDKALAQNGLAMKWAGKVYCNPPYGKPISAWVVKAMTEETDELIMLVPAYTDTRWFRPLFGCTLCFIGGRLKFRKPASEGGGQVQAPHPSVLVYRGPRSVEFARHFSIIGPVVQSVAAQRSETQTLWQLND